MTAPLQCQQDAARFASTPDQTEVYERHLGVRAAVALLVAGHRSEERAARRRPVYAVLARSVERQARIQGLGSIRVERAASA